MTPAEILIAEALWSCTFLPGSWDKRFARGLDEQARNAPDRPLSERQISWLLRLAQKYRRQMPTKVLELVLDEMERNAERRVAAGQPALPDFTPARRRALRDEKATRQAGGLPLFDR